MPYITLSKKFTDLIDKNNFYDRGYIPTLSPYKFFIKPYLAVRTKSILRLGYLNDTSWERLK